MTESDYRNPCTLALRDFCKKRNISCHIQQGSLQQDVTTVARARYFITSQSSFSWSFLRCNPYCKAAFIPNIRFPKTPLFPENPVKLPYEQHFYGLPDYICAKEWKYIPQQLNTMVEYPMEKIQVKIIERLESLESLESL